MSGIRIGEYPVKVFLCEDGFWKHDSVFIQVKCISEKEISSIMDYLYDEGFIQDRRTKFFITRPEQ